MLTVRDTGSGIAPELFDKVLEPFFTTKSANKGTGLGLSMVHGFVHRSKGQIKIHSELEKGTEIRLYFPRSYLSDEITRSSITVPKTLPCGNETILVVDDEQHLCDVAKTQLKNLGYSVYTSNNPSMALEMLQNNRKIDLLFSDIVMSDNMDGYEMANSALKLNPSLKILLTSGFTQNLETNRNDKNKTISQHYIGNELNSGAIPKEIIITQAIESQQEITQVISTEAGFEVKISHNVRTERGQYLKLACTNAETALMTRNSHKESMQARFSALNEVFELSNGISRIECFDISHTMGQQTVASNVVFNQEGPLKSDYRRYNVHGITPGDDYAAMAFALDKRYSKVTSEEKMPDIIFIDGGKGQLSKAEEFFAGVDKVKTPLLVGVAKGESRKPGLETLILAGSHQLISLPATSPALHLVQHIRDESHRFAITGHRAKRQKASKKSTLETIPGIGAKKRQALLQYLGGLQEVLKADKTTLEKVPGISKLLAENIYDALHDN